MITNAAKFNLTALSLAFILAVGTTATSAAAGPDNSSARWADIKDCSYDLRAQFLVGLKKLEARVDDQVAELGSKRPAMKGTPDYNEWDFAMKESIDAQSYLKAVDIELRKATRESWDQDKETVSRAWIRTQDANDKTKHSATL